MFRNPLISLMIAIIVFSPWAIIIQNNDLNENNEILHSSAPPSANDDDYTDFGNGSAENSYWVGSSGNSGIQDTWLSAAQPSNNYGNDTELKAGFSANASSRWNTLFGIELSQANIFTNVTIQSATLALHVKQFSGQPEIRSWVVYDESWDADTTDWNSWTVGGALGNDDSGGLIDEVIVTSQGWIEIDVTRSVEVAYDRYINGNDPSASVLLTGPAWGEEWATFHSSEYVFSSERPHLNVTYDWGNSALPITTEWVDVFPKPPHRIDADNLLNLEAQARSGTGYPIAGMVSWASNTGSVDSGGLFTPDIAGTAQITATIAGVTGSLPLQVEPGTPVNLDLETKSVELTIDDFFQFNSTFVDANGNSVDSATLTWYSDYGIVNETGYYQPTTVGSDQVTVMWQSLFATADITVSAGSATNITIESNLSVASGEQIPIIYTVTDRLGNLLPNQAAGSISWDVGSGHVDGVGIYTGGEVGTWRINATSTSGASGHTYVEVTPGALSSIELIAPNGSQPADEAVLLIVNWLDVMGNVVPVRIPLSNWSAEDGNFRMTPAGVEWLPRREGVWQVGVHVEDEWSNITITVTHGSVDRLLITTETEVISADDVLPLTLTAEDSKGNRWQVNGTWLVLEPEAAPWLSPIQNGAQFEGVVAGNWTIKAQYNDGNNDFSTFLVLEVIPGSLAQIILAGEGTQVSADSWIDFEPTFFDEDGNQLNDIQLNWSFIHHNSQTDKTEEMRTNDAIWYPVLSGHHEIEVEAAGVFASLGIDIEPGIAHTIRALETSGVIVESGNITSIQINATDLDGNDFGSDVIWSIPHNSVDLANGTRAGEYLLRGIEAGTHNLQFHSGLADGSFTVTVHHGEVVNIVISIAKESAKTGDIIDVEVTAYDYGGNKISLNPDNVQLTSSAGKFGYSTGNFWQMVIQNSGSQQRISVVYETAQGEAFIDVTADPLRAFGDSNLATGLWVGIAVTVVMFGLLIARLRIRSREEEDALDHHFGVDEPQKTFDPMAGYKPSKKARAAARQAFTQMQPQMTQQQWGYQQMPQMVQPAPIEMASTSEPVTPAIATTPQQIEQTEPEVWTNNTSDTQITQTTEIDEPTWTTEQVWEWGRTQGWSDEQIAAYEMVYDQSVRNPDTQSNAEIAASENTQEQDEKTEVIVHDEPTPTHETVVEEVVDPIPQESQASKPDVRKEGIMKAMSGTTQGEAGWYLDGEGNPSRWGIDGDGTWHQTG